MNSNKIIYSILTGLFILLTPFAQVSDLDYQDPIPQAGEVRLPGFRNHHNIELTAHVSASGNAQGEHPVELLFDGDSSNWYGLMPFSNRATVKLDFPEEIYLEAYELRGFLPNGSRIYLQILRNDQWITIPASYIQGQGQEESWFLDLSRDLTLADKLMIQIEGADLSDLRLNEMKLLTQSEDFQLSKKQMTPRSLYFPRNQLNNDFILVDGRIGTSWHSLNRGFNDMVYWLHRGGNDWDNDDDDHWDRSCGWQGYDDDHFHDIDSSYHSFYRWRRRDDIIFNVNQPGEMEFFKFYLNDQAQGVLEFFVKVDGQWLSLEEFTLDQLEGWQQIPLDGLGEIEKIRLGLHDPQRPWGGGHYGGIGEVELWATANPDVPLQRDIVSPGMDQQDCIFDLNDKEEADYYIQIAGSPGPDSNGPDLILNGYLLESSTVLDYPGSRIWEYPVEDHFLYYRNNSLNVTAPEGMEIYSSHLVVRNSRGAQLNIETLSDGLRYSQGNDLGSPWDPVLLELLEGQMDMEEIQLYFQDREPGDLSARNQGLEHYLEALSTDSRSHLFRDQEEMDRLALDQLGALSEVEALGSPNEILIPHIELIFPLEGLELPQNVTWYYKVLGITDSPQAEITVNGQVAQVRENYFWVEMRDLGMREPGLYNIEAQVTLPNGNSSSDSAEIRIQSESSRLRIDQSDRLHRTGEAHFTLSGRVQGWNTQLLIQGEIVPVRRNRFHFDVPLESGMNDIEILLRNGNGTRELQRATRRVFYQAGSPTLIIDSPINNSLTNQDTVAVSGRVSTWELEELRINGLEAQVQGGRFYHGTIPLAYEDNRIIVEAEYDDDLVVEEIVWVIKDQTAPLLSEISPPPETMIGTASVAITGKVEEANGCSIFINGHVAEISGNSFQRVIPLPLEGWNSVKITARDQAGNQVEWPTFRLFRDLTGPESFQATAAPERWTNNRRPIISFETTDASIGMSHYEVAIGDRPFYPQTSPYQLPYMNDGVTEITVRALDLFGNYTDSKVKVYIDTTPPDQPGNFRAVPGLDRVLLRWEEDDFETRIYRMGREGSGHVVEVSIDDDQGFEDGVFLFEQPMEGLTPGGEYRFWIEAVDRAGNTGPRSYSEVTLGEASAEALHGETTLVEVDGVSLHLPPGSIPEDLSRINVEIIEESPSMERALNPVVSPVYSFTVSSRNHGELEHYLFDKPYIGVISYENLEIPAHIPEHRLAVFFYDEYWGTWTMAENCLVSTKEDLIYFAADHFSEALVQATITDTIDYREWKGVEYPLSSDTVCHSPISVSPQGGSVSSSMTELVLPGKNGLDLVLQRSYSSTVAEADSLILPVNSMTEIENPEGVEDPVQYLEDFMNSQDPSPINNGSKWNNEWIRDRRRFYTMGRSDFTHSLGQGWRLEVPHIKFSDNGTMIKTTGGYIYSRDLYCERNSQTGDYTIRDSLNGEISIYSELIPYDHDPDQLHRRYTVTTRDGTDYVYNQKGLIEYVQDTFGNRISYYYNDENSQLERIVDSHGRVVLFSYLSEESFIPPIQRIEIYDSADATEGVVHQGATPEYFIDYYFDTESSGDVGMPLLARAEDVQGREWNYEYDTLYLSCQYPESDKHEVEPVKNSDGEIVSYSHTTIDLPTYYPGDHKQQFVFPLTSVDGPGVGYQEVTYGSNLREVDFRGETFRGMTAFFDKIGNSADLRAATQALAVCSLERFSDDDSNDPTVIVNYSYEINSNGMITQTSINDGALLEILEFEEKTYRILASNGNRDYTEVKFVGQVNQQLYTLDASAGQTLVEERITQYHRRVQQPSLEIVHYGDRNGDRIERSYDYDTWANLEFSQVTEYTGDVQNVSQTYHWYLESPDIPTEITQRTNPTAANNLELLEENGIRDRLVHTVSTWKTVNEELEEEEKELGSCTNIRESYFHYGGEGQLLESAQWTGNEWAENSYGYDSSGQLISHTNPLELKTEISYEYSSSSSFHIITTKELNQQYVNDADPDGALITRDRTSIVRQDRITGWVLEELRPDNATTVYERDNLGRITQVTLPREAHESENPTIKINYNDNDMVVTQTDQLGNDQKYYFNNRGEIIQIERFSGSSANEALALQVTEIEQDYRGNITKVTNPANEEVLYSYDGMNRILQESYTEEGEVLTVEYRYDDRGRRRIVTNEAQLQQVHHLDAAGRTLELHELRQSGSVMRTTQSSYNPWGDLVKQVDGMGITTEYRYDPLGNLTETLSSEEDFYWNGEEVIGQLSSHRVYNVLGLVTQEYLMLGDQEINRKSYSYDSLGRLSSEFIDYTDYSDLEETSQRATQSYRYDLLDRLRVRIDPNGKAWETAYTLRGQVSEEISPLSIGGRTSYSYDSKDRLTSMTDAQQNSGSYPGYNGTISYQYDSLDRLVEALLPNVPGEEPRIVQFGYDVEGNLEYRQDPDDGVTRYTYTQQNRVETETRQNSLADPTVSYETKYQYDALGRLEQITQPNGGIQKFSYDDLGRKIQENLPGGGLSRFGYDLNGNMTWSEDPRGIREIMEYDSLNRLVERIDGANQSWTFDYHPLGGMGRTEDPLEITREYSYDQRGMVLEETDGQDLVTQYFYDKNGNLKKRVDPRGTTIEYTYRADNLPLTVSYSNTDEGRSHNLSYGYDVGGRLISATDNGITTYYNRDAQGAYFPHPMGITTRQETVGYSDVQYSYDEMDRMTYLQNGIHDGVTYQYNNLGELTGIPGYIDEAPLYYDDGLLKSYTLANGVSSTRSYDSRMRLSTLSYSSRLGDSLKSYEYVYDQADNLVIENNNRYGYDARNMLAFALISEAAVEPEEEPVAEFNSLTALDDVIGQSMALPLDENEMEVSLDYGGRSLAVDTITPILLKRIVLHVEGPSGARIEPEDFQLYTSMSNWEESYRLANAVCSIDLTDDGNRVSGRITLELSRGVTAQFIKVHCHFNDRDEEYLAVEYPTKNIGLVIGSDLRPEIEVVRLVGGGRNETYSYNGRGNRDNRTITEQGVSDIGEYVYYAGSDWLKFDGYYSYRYDDNGNLIEKGLNIAASGDTPVFSQEEEYWSYEYDLRNRLKRVEWKNRGEALSSGWVEYTYDANGYRIKKTNSDGEEVKFVFDNNGNMIEEIHNDVSSIQYIFWGRQHLAQIDSEGTKYFGTNHLGTTTLLTGADGSILMNMETTPFGDEIKEGLFYTGKQWDEDVELYYFNMRWYDADTGRFITEDPIKDGLLHFAYVNNNPLRFVDPTGLAREDRQARRAARRERRSNRQRTRQSNRGARSGSHTSRSAERSIPSYTNSSSRNPYREQVRNSARDPWKRPIDKSLEDVPGIVPGGTGYPTSNPRFSRRFGIDYGFGIHGGDDLIGDNNNNVYAVRDGVTVFAGDDPRIDDDPRYAPNAPLTDQYTNNPRAGNPGCFGVGYLVGVMTKNGNVVLDGHTDPSVSAGDRVNSGDVIGQYDNIGASNGAHDHHVEAQVQNSQGQVVRDPSAVNREMVKQILYHSGYENNLDPFQVGDYTVTIVRPTYGQ